MSQNLPLRRMEQQVCVQAVLVSKIFTTMNANVRTFSYKENRNVNHRALCQNGPTINLCELERVSLSDVSTEISCRIVRKKKAAQQQTFPRSRVSIVVALAQQPHATVWLR